MEALAEVVSAVLLAAGSLVVVVTGIAFLRLPTFYARAHGASLSDGLGAGLILLGLAFAAGPSLVAAKLLLVLAFSVFSSPAAVHALAKAAYLHGVTPRLPGEHPEMPAEPEALIEAPPGERPSPS